MEFHEEADHLDEKQVMQMQSTQDWDWFLMPCNGPYQVTTGKGCRHYQQ